MPKKQSPAHQNINYFFIFVGTMRGQGIIGEVVVVVVVLVDVNVATFSDILNFGEGLN